MMEKASIRGTILAICGVVAVFVIHVGLGWYFFPGHGNHQIDSANDLWWVLLLFAWLADWSIIFHLQGMRFSDELRLRGSIALALIAACAGWLVYMSIGLNLYGS
jgi:hypothetical protein